MPRDRSRRHNPRDPRCDCGACYERRRLAVYRYRRSYSYETGELTGRQTGQCGTPFRYPNKCRCDACKASNLEWRRMNAARLRGGT